MRFSGCGEPGRDAPSLEDQTRRKRAAALSDSIDPETPVDRALIAPESIARNTGFALGVKLTGAVFTAGLTIFLVRFLGPAEYGIFALALSVGSLLLIPSDLGISQSSARFIAEVREDRDAVGEIVSDAVRLKLLVSGAFSATLIAAAGLVAQAYDEPDLTWPLRIVAIVIFGQSMVLLFSYVFEALGRVSASLRLLASESAIETALSIGIVLLGTGAAGAMVGRAGAYAFAAGYGIVLIRRAVDRRVAPRRQGHRHARRIIRYGSVLMIVDSAFALYAQIDVLLIGAILNVSAVGLFHAPVKLTAFLAYIGVAARSGVAPRMQAGDSSNRERLERALRYLILLQGLVLAPMIVWAEPVTRTVLGPAYLESAPVLRTFVVYAFLLAISPLLAGTVNYLGGARSRVPIALGTLAVNIVISLLLIPEIGIVGGAIATNVSYVLYVGAHFRICRRLVGLRVAPLLGTLSWTLLAALGMSAVLLPLGTGDIGVPKLLVGGVLGGLAYVGVLVLSGQVTPSELSRVRLALRLRR